MLPRICPSLVQIAVFVILNLKNMNCFFSLFTLIVRKFGCKSEGIFTTVRSVCIKVIDLGGGFVSSTGIYSGKLASHLDTLVNGSSLCQGQITHLFFHKQSLMPKRKQISIIIRKITRCTYVNIIKKNNLLFFFSVNRDRRLANVRNAGSVTLRTKTGVHFVQ